MSLQEKIVELERASTEAYTEAQELMMMDAHNEGVGYRQDAESTYAYADSLRAERDKLLEMEAEEYNKPLSCDKCGETSHPLHIGEYGGLECRICK